MPNSSIPDELPNFVGRDKECKAVEHHLTDEVTRLVNIWGPPGFGKTSVAIRVAHVTRQEFSSLLRFCSWSGKYGGFSVKAAQDVRRR